MSAVYIFIAAGTCLVILPHTSTAYNTDSLCTNKLGRLLYNF